MIASMAPGPLALAAILAAAPGYTSSSAPPAPASPETGTPGPTGSSTGTVNPPTSSAPSNQGTPSTPSNPGPPSSGAYNPATPSNPDPPSSAPADPAPPLTRPTHPPERTYPPNLPTTPTGVIDPTRAPPQRLHPPPTNLLGPPPPGPPPLFPAVPHELRPPPPSGTGNGLFAGAAVAAAANVGLAIARLGLSLGDVNERKETISFYLGTIGTPITIAAGVGLAAGGGYLRGRQDGYRSAYDGVLKVRGQAFSQAGIALLVMGAAGYVMAWIPWQGDGSIDARGGGTLLVESAASLLLMTGSGFIAYGTTWRKHAEQHGYYRRLGLRPAIGPRFTGLTLTARF